MREGEIARADELFAPVLAVRPTDGEVLFWSARLARLKGDPRDAHRRLKLAEGREWVPELLTLEYHLLALQRGDHTPVAALIQMIERKHPDDVFILEVLTPALFANYQIDRAFVCVQRWVEIQPGRVAAWLLYAQISERLSNGEEIQRGYRRVLELAPDHLVARNGLIDELLVSRQAPDALPVLEQLLADHPSDRTGRLKMAKCRRMIGEHSVARTILDELLRESPNDAMILAERGTIEMESGEPGEAEKWYREAVRHPSFEPSLYLQFAVCLERNDRREEAAEQRVLHQRAESDLARVREVARAISLQPRNVELRREAGEIMLRNHREADGIRWLQSVLELVPQDRDTHRLLAAYYEKRDPEKARQHFRFVN